MLKVITSLPVQRPCSPSDTITQSVLRLQSCPSISQRDATRQAGCSDATFSSESDAFGKGHREEHRSTTPGDGRDPDRRTSRNKSILRNGARSARTYETRTPSVTERDLVSGLQHPAAPAHCAIQVSEVADLR